MASTKRGSIFLLTLTLMTMVFILAFAFTFFTGSEDYSAAMSYESEVAFNLAESAIEEFVARLKCSLNHDDSNNKLYKVLRAYDLDVSKEIPIEQQQMVNLTSITREVAQEVYGYQFGRGLSDSKDFIVEAKVIVTENEYIFIPSLVLKGQPTDTYVVSKDKCDVEILGILHYVQLKI